MGYRDLNVSVNNTDYASISCKNFVNFDPVTPVKTGLILYLFTTWQKTGIFNQISQEILEKLSALNLVHFPEVSCTQNDERGQLLHKCNYVETLREIKLAYRFILFAFYLFYSTIRVKFIAFVDFDVSIHAT